MLKQEIVVLFIFTFSKKRENQNQLGIIPDGIGLVGMLMNL